MRRLPPSMVTLHRHTTTRPYLNNIANIRLDMKPNLLPLCTARRQNHFWLWQIQMSQYRRHKVLNARPCNRVKFCEKQKPNFQLSYKNKPRKMSAPSQCDKYKESTGTVQVAGSSEPLPSLSLNSPWSWPVTHRLISTSPDSSFPTSHK